MRNKSVMFAGMAAGAMLLGACSTSLPSSVDTSKLNDDERAVIATWYDVSSSDARETIEKLDGLKIKASATAFKLLCVVSEDARAQELEKATGDGKLSQAQAKELSKSIQVHLCDKAGASSSPASTQKGKTTPTS
ncbi:hypothetical protein [Streptomyces noursei]